MNPFPPLTAERGAQIRKLFAIFLLAGIVIGGVRTELLPFLVTLGRPVRPPGDLVGLDWRPLRERRDPLPPDLAAALLVAKRELRHGDAVALVYAPPANAHSYLYYRSVYLLAPRPVFFPRGPQDPGFGWRIAKARLVVCWKMDLRLQDFDVIWKRGNVQLMRRRA